MHPNSHQANQLVNAASPDLECADILEAIMVKHGLDPYWSDIYEASALPDTLSGIRKAFQAAFGGDIRPVVPTAKEFNVFGGVRLSGRERNLFVNVEADFGFVKIARRVLWKRLPGRTHVDEKPHLRRTPDNAAEDTVNMDSRSIIVNEKRH